jgi:ribosomal protein S18 acetylase RimI-like enzyme
MAKLLAIRSLGYRTDLFFRSFEGEIVEREHYTVIRTPKNPTFRWGNFLLFKQPPTDNDFESWSSAFKREHPNALHMVLGWDDPENAGQVASFTSAGFEFDSSVVMTASSVHAPLKLVTNCLIRPLENADWPSWVAMECATNMAQPESDREGDGYGDFLQRKGEELKQMAHAGHGHFWGAFVDGKLAASAGLYFWQGIGRFQWVGTHPVYRRRGLCSTLVHHISKLGLEKVDTLVMVADPEYVAASIYESIGFKASEKQFGLDKVNDL